MKIQTLVIAVALATGTALAAAPKNTANTPYTKTATTTTTTTTTTTKKSTMHHHGKVAKKKVAKKHHAVHSASTHTSKKQHTTRHAAMHRDMAYSGTPQTNVDDQRRQGRMDEALAKYRRSPG